MGSATPSPPDFLRDQISFLFAQHRNCFCPTLRKLFENIFSPVTLIYLIYICNNHSPNENVFGRMEAFNLDATPPL